MTVHIPCGKHTLACELSDAAVLTSHVNQLRSSQSGLEIVRKAMAAPIDSPRLEDLARGKRTCTVIISDHTRPVPSRDILPPMLEELRRGNPEIDITLLVATGFHRGTTRDELRAKLGDDVFLHEKVVVHDCRDKDSNVKMPPAPRTAGSAHPARR